MRSQRPHPATTPVVWNVRSLAHHQNQQKRRPWGNSQLPTAKRRVSIPAGERESSHRGSPVASTIQGQIYPPSSSPNNFHVAYSTQRVTSTLSAAQRWSINTPTATLGTNCLSTISKKHFRPGGMAAPEWTCSVRAVRDTPVADYSTPSVNTTCHIAYCPPIAVSQLLWETLGMHHLEAVEVKRWS